MSGVAAGFCSAVPFPFAGGFAFSSAMAGIVMPPDSVAAARPAAKAFLRFDSMHALLNGISPLVRTWLAYAVDGGRIIPRHG